MDEQKPDELVAPKPWWRKGSNLLLVVAVLVILGLGGLVSIFRTPGPPAMGPAVPDLTLKEAMANAVPQASTEAPGPPQDAAVVRPSESWRISESGVSEMDDSLEVVASLDAIAPIHFWLGEETPQLIARCAERKSELYIVFGSAMNPELGEYNRYTARVRLDDKPPRRQMWSQSTDNKALFAPSAIGLMRQIARAKSMKVEVTPFNSSPVVASFNVKGFDQHIGHLAKACGWKP